MVWVLCPLDTWWAFFKCCKTHTNTYAHMHCCQRQNGIQIQPFISCNIDAVVLKHVKSKHNLFELNAREKKKTRRKWNGLNLIESFGTAAFRCIFWKLFSIGTNEKKKEERRTQQTKSAEWAIHKQHKKLVYIWITAFPLFYNR